MTDFNWAARIGPGKPIKPECDDAAFIAAFNETTIKLPKAIDNVHPNRYEPAGNVCIKTTTAAPENKSDPVREAYPESKDFVSFMTLSKVIVPRYLAMLSVDHGRDWNEDRFGDKTSLGHLKWMLTEIADNLKQSITKKNRWLGFVQGLLIAYGFTTVSREREMTREIFNGA